MQEVRTRGGPQYRIQLRYQYAVNGTVYTGERFNNRNNYVASEERARALTMTYSPGAKCQVSYNPGDPADSVIEPEITWHTWVRLALAVVGLLLEAWLAYLGLKEFLTKRREIPTGQRPPPA